MRIYLLLLIAHHIKADFILREINMDDATFEACQQCDESADRAGSQVTATSISEFMKNNFVKIVVDEGDVFAKQSYPTEKIDTGHSCKYTAEARNIVGTAKMLPGSVELAPFGILYSDRAKNSFAVADVIHSLTVDMDVRVWNGVRIIGCIRMWRKTCATTGRTQGVNKISANFAASNTLTECIGGQEHISFNMDVTVTDEVKNHTYDPVTVERRGDCSLDVFGIKIGSINNKIQNYATRYVNRDSDRFRELRGPKLVAELERKLGVKLGSLVTLKINDEFGNPRTCSSRRKRSSRCVRKSCPKEFTRIGESDKCQKSFGGARPDCKQYGSAAELIEKNLNFCNIKLYWCHVPIQIRES